MNTVERDWVCDTPEKLPDFMIMGAMKSGTTSLHHTLNCHPEVFLPDNEVFFFDMDDVIEHPDFSHFAQQHWQQHRIELNKSHYWQWYLAKFNAPHPQMITGEDSTTYLASERAIKRIAMQDKAVKLVVVLRQPTERVYSHYWHMLKAGKAIFSFEKTIEYLPHLLLSRSQYKQQLEVLYRHIPKEQIKIVLFDELTQQPVSTIKSICEFINVNAELLPKSAYSIHANKGKVPRFIGLDIIKNRLFRGVSNRAYEQHFGLEQDKKYLISNGFNRVYRQLNPLIEKKVPPMNKATREFLDTYFYTQLQGLDALIERPVMDLWFNRLK